MADKKPTYREQQDAKRILQIREISKELPQACSDFFNGIALTTGTLTRLAYAIDLKTFFHFLHHERVSFSQKKIRLLRDEDIESVTRSDLDAYVEFLMYYFREDDELEGLPLKAITNKEKAIKRKLCSVRSFYDFLFKSGRIHTNNTQLIELPKIHEKPIILLTRKEMERILYEADTGSDLTEQQKRFQKKTAKRDYALLSLFLGTGIRVSECVGINIEDVDLKDNAFVVTRKGGNQMVLYFPQEVSDALQAYLEERQEIEPMPGHENAFFLSLQRKRITQRAVQNLVKKYASVAAPLKPKISPHKLRSTYATNLYQATGDIYLVADVLGHSSVDTTRKHYADMTDERRRTAANYVNLPDNSAQPSSASTPQNDPSVHTEIHIDENEPE